MEDFYQMLDVMAHPGEKVLATIVGVKGSAYKREGSSMMFFEDGSHAGLLSAGCLETDLAIRAAEVFQKNEAIILQYDMFEEDDMGWGQGAGCNGTIDILLELVTEKLTEDFLLVKRLLDRNKPVIGLKKLDKLGEYVFIEEEGEAFGNWSGPIPVTEFTLKSGIMADGALTFYQHTYQPKPRLIVFGAGPDARPLVSLAAETGFSVTVCDWREEYCQKQHFPTADRIIVGFPDALLKQISFLPYDFVVIMSHHFLRDQEILLSLLNENIRYLGVLGPRKRTKKLLNPDHIPSSIFSPIGVAIGAKGPVEIAVSIMAEMIEVWRKPVHERVELLWTISD
ncbi:XdhC/CoxI family protein [Neobacillus sp.]|uniref:XdhC family protein n=1 Tax=Neobacillus sp. TaxID=2675273 RepID=UPI00289C843A|nr:XdhC/CoxI family protein [Neobacillus sp.]